MEEKPDILFKVMFSSVGECNPTLAENKVSSSTRVLRNGLNQGQLCAFDAGTIKDSCPVNTYHIHGNFQFDTF